MAGLQEAGVEGCNLKIISMAPSTWSSDSPIYTKCPCGNWDSRCLSCFLPEASISPPTPETGAGTALHRVLPPCLHLQRDQDDDGEAAQVCPRRGSLLHLPDGHPLRLRHLLHCHDRMWDCLSSPFPGQARRGQILPWLHTPGTSSITEGVSQSRIWSHPVLLLIIDFSGQMRLNPLSSYCSKH